MCPYWESMGDEISLLLLTTGTHIWRSPYGLGGYAIPVPDVEVQTLRGTESSFHEFHGNFRKLHQLLKFFCNKKKETLDLASSWFIFSVWWQHELDETPNLLGITLHNSGKTAVEWMTQLKEKTQCNLVSEDCVRPLDLESTQQGFTQSNARLSRKDLQGL